MNVRLEAFSDGVFAIALTLLIIDLRVPDVGGNLTAPALWSALAQMGPAIFAFLLSFTVILITWINHHNTVALVKWHSAAFMYANGVLLLTVVCIPFTTSLLGAYLPTTAAAPAVALYAATLAAQAVAWVCISGVALHDQLATDQVARAALRVNRNRGFGAMGLYTALAVCALWQPRAVAIITALTWVIWLVVSLRTHRPESVPA